MPNAAAPFFLAAFKRAPPGARFPLFAALSALLFCGVLPLSRSVPPIVLKRLSVLRLAVLTKKRPNPRNPGKIL